MSGQGKYKMRTIARLTGLTPALLRAWERRHGLLDPGRTEGGHRLYTEDDLAVLRQVERLLAEGRSIGEVAVLGRPELLARSRVRPGPAGGPTGQGPEGPGTTPEPAGQPVGLDPLLEAIVQAAVDIDHPALERSLDAAFALVSPEYAVGQVLEPAARRIGELWVEGRCSVAGEHMASSAFILRLQKLLENTNRILGDASPQVVTACFPDELHEVGALVVAYLLTLNGIRVVHLGAALPFEDLERAMEVLHPSGVYLSVTREAIFRAHRPHLLELVRRRNGGLVMMLGGQGVRAGDTELEELGIRIVPEGRSAREAGEALLPVR
jgi:methanogenic corrinoid protein MtbC1